MTQRWKTWLAVDETQTAGVLDSAYFFPVNEFGPAAPEKNHNVADVAMGGRQFYRAVETQRSLGGSIEFEADPETLGRMLEWGLGAAVSTPLGIGNQTSHVFKALNAGTILKEFYMVEFKPVTGETYGKLWGPAKINTLGLSAVSGEKLMATVDWVGRGDTDAADNGTPNFGTDLLLKPFIFKDLTFQQVDHGGALAGLVTVEQFDLNINNNLITDKRTADGTLYPAAFPEGKVEISGSLIVEFDDATLFWDQFMAETEKAMRATFQSDLMPGGTNYYKLILDLPRVHLMASDRGGSIGGGNDRLRETVQFRALVDSVAVTDLIVTLQNMTTAY